MTLDPSEWEYEPNQPAYQVAADRAARKYESCAPPKQTVAEHPEHSDEEVAAAEALPGLERWPGMGILAPTSTPKDRVDTLSK